MCMAHHRIRGLEKCLRPEVCVCVCVSECVRLVRVAGGKNFLLFCFFFRRWDETGNTTPKTYTIPSGYFVLYE